MGDLTDNFSVSEFECSCNYENGKLADAPAGVRENIRELAERLQDLRNLIHMVYGVEHYIHINSGYRCVKHNRDVGGSRNSQHKLGKAADVRVVSKESGKQLKPGVVAFLAKSVNEFNRGGIGVYDTFTHLDIREGTARWGKRWIEKKGNLEDYVE